MHDLSWKGTNRLCTTSRLIGWLAVMFAAVPLLGQGYLSALESNKKVVFDFYRLVIEPRNADLIDLYISPDFVDHDQSDQKGSEAVAKMLKALGPAPSEDVGATLRNPPAFIVAQSDLIIWLFPQRPPQSRGTVRT